MNLFNAPLSVVIDFVNDLPEDRNLTQEEIREILFNILKRTLIIETVLARNLGVIKEIRDHERESTTSNDASNDDRHGTATEGEHEG